MMVSGTFSRFSQLKNFAKWIKLNEFYPFALIFKHFRSKNPSNAFVLARRFNSACLRDEALVPTSVFRTRAPSIAIHLA